MPSVSALGRTQTLRVQREGALSYTDVVSRIAEMPDPERHLQDWGWVEAYERTFSSGDALLNDANVVQITLQRFSSPGPAADLQRYFAGARLAGTALSIQPPHAQHPDWLKLAGPTTGGNEVTYYAVSGNVLVRVLTVAVGDPAADATDIMGRTLRLLGGGAGDTVVVDPPTRDSGESVAVAEFNQVDGFWRSLVIAEGWYVSPALQTFDGPVSTGCGYIAEDPGPFYCPADETIYLNLPVVEQLNDEEFVLGLFIAHEWGHHIEMLAGYQKSEVPLQVGQTFSVNYELAADCMAGIWAKGEYWSNRATEDQIYGALDLMISLGDTEGSPLTAIDAHGTGEMRGYAFALGFRTADPKACEDQYLKA